jgi:hypothetical protein
MKATAEEMLPATCLGDCQLSVPFFFFFERHYIFRQIYTIPYKHLLDTKSKNQI